MKRLVTLGLVLSLSFGAYAQPAALDLGNLTGDLVHTDTLTAGSVDWYMFTIGDLPYIDISTNDSTFDTEIGLYDAAGALIANNDDDGIGLTSVLTFGTGSGLLLGDSYNLGGNGIAEGENGLLGAGTYYLAFGGYNTVFNADNWDVTTTSTYAGDYIISFYIPEPASIALLALGAISVLRRR